MGGRIFREGGESFSCRAITVLSALKPCLVIPTKRTR